MVPIDKIVVRLRDVESVVKHINVYVANTMPHDTAGVARAAIDLFFQFIEQTRVV